MANNRPMTEDEKKLLQAQHRMEAIEARNRQKERKARTRRLIQMGAGMDKEENLLRAAEFVKKCKEKEADIAVLPEIFNGPYSNDYFRPYAEPVKGKSWKALSRMAKDNQLWLVGGSIPEIDEEGKVYNTSFVFDPEGGQVARHRKMHLFDIDVKGGQSFKESDTFTAGDEVTVFDTPWGKIGLCICFDFRFPELSRLMVLGGAQVLVVPAAWFWGVAMRPAGSAAPAQYSLQSAGGAADEGQETEQAPRVAAAQDTAGTVSSAAAAPETTEDAQAGARKEGRLLFAAEGGGMGMGDITVRTDADLAGANPTYDLPAGELPTELPVYAVPDGEAEMRAALEDTAAKLGGTLEAFSYDTSGPPDTAYYSPYASGKADGVSYSLNGQEVHFYRYEQGDNLLAAPKGLSGEALYRYFYDHFGAKFVTLENPVFESTGDYNIYKEYSTAISAFYEAGSASDTLAQKLYNYSFRRIQLSAPEGDLTAVTFPLEPQVLGTYALRTLDDAKGALMAGEAWIGGTQGGYDGGAVNILHWEITYYRSRLMDTIQPVYCFLIDSPDGEAPFFDDGDPEGYKSVTYAYVPALLPEQLSENTFVQVFN